ncbi:TfoX/Sxy family protein [Agrococcus sp. HG114]|uniref:TfoX/Sxy family protein n=1 Tax=Agrococcus sp. HG114 TaxID=2969757 RepID=UPI00215AB647|nr:TfoX/Sxy family protein [Agrococcus sp. HG114]MCR8670724.1 TfoX/Sxy family protein [Agrococcus sp. HG114]
MPNRPETIERIHEALDPLPIRVRAMFGEHAVYCDDRIFAFVCDDTLLLKLVPEASELTADLPRGEAYPGSKPYGVVDADRLADTEWLHEVAQTIAATQPRKAPKPPRRQGGGRPGRPAGGA